MQIRGRAMYYYSSSLNYGVTRTTVTKLSVSMKLGPTENIWTENVYEDTRYPVETRNVLIREHADAKCQLGVYEILASNGTTILTWIER